MIIETARERPLRLAYVVGLLLLTVGYRVVSVENPALPNTSPLMAICFGGGMLFGRRFWWVPLALVLLSDVMLGFASGAGLGAHNLFTLPFFLGVTLVAAFAFSRQAHWLDLLAGSLAFSLLFYLAANTFAWAGMAEYPKTLAGWWQSQTIGLPGYPPSALFLRNSLIADTLWCVAALPLFLWAPLRAPKPAGATPAHSG